MSELTLSDIMSVLRATEDPEAIWALVTRYYREHGVQKMSYHRYRGVTPDLPGTPGVFVRAEGFGEDWVCHYIEQKLFLIDPIPQLAKLAAGPFFWRDVAGLARITPDQLGYLAQMEEAGVGDGLAMTVYGPAMRNAYVGLGFGLVRPELSPAVVTEFQCVAQIAHIRVCELLAEREAMQFDLAPREREILHWISRGKSNAAIAAILSVSPHTVDTLTRRLFAKLDVVDRTSAAIKGVGAGLVLPG